MNTNQYTKIFNAIENSYQNIICEYCGFETPSIDERCICFNCESFVHSTRAMLEKKDSILLDTLDNIRKSINESKYADAIALYDKLIKERNDPALMYASALVYMSYSNYELSLISYGRSGFMEENAQHRNNAAKLASISKKLLAKSISALEGEISKAADQTNLFYPLFLSQIKLGSYRGAQSSISGLRKSGNNYLTYYSAMVLDVSMGNYTDAMKNAEMLLSKGNFSINALFYIAFCQFKDKKYKDAEKLFTAINGIIKSDSIGRMLSEVKAKESI